jgi:hypothetical protein
MKKMKKIALIFALMITAVSFLGSCNDDNVIDDNGLLITQRSQCYMSFFDILGPDNVTSLAGGTIIDTVALTVNATAKLGTNLKRVKPYCSVVTDAIVEPAMGTWVDFSSPREYTVISGNRKVKKTYTITITLQQ